MKESTFRTTRLAEERIAFIRHLPWKEEATLMSGGPTDIS